MTLELRERHPGVMATLWYYGEIASVEPATMRNKLARRRLAGRPWPAIRPGKSASCVARLYAGGEKAETERHRAWRLNSRPIKIAVRGGEKRGTSALSGGGGIGRNHDHSR